MKDDYVRQRELIDERALIVFEKLKVESLMIGQGWQYFLLEVIGDHF